MMALFYSVRQGASMHYSRALKARAAKWNSATIHFIIYTCDFPTVTSQNAVKNPDFPGEFWGDKPATSFK